MYPHIHTYTLRYTNAYTLTYTHMHVYTCTFFFLLQDYGELRDFFKSTFKKDLKEVDLCVKGWNWGEAKVTGSLLSFMVDSKRVFEIPLKEVSQVCGERCLLMCELSRVLELLRLHRSPFFPSPPHTLSPTAVQVTSGKNEVTLEFHQSEEAAQSLVEMRFHIPVSAQAEVEEDRAKVHCL